MKAKNIIRNIALVLVALIITVSLASCDGDKTDGIVLIENGEAKFRLVNTSGMGSSARRAVEDFIEKLEELGVDGAASIDDGNADLVTDCEIIVGTGARNRGDECNISEHDLGEDGYVIKAVGNKIVIAGGTPQMTLKAFEIFLKEYIGFDEDTAELEDVEVPKDLNVVELTQYKVDSISIAGNDLKDFKLVIPTNDPAIKNAQIKNIQSEIYRTSGCWLDMIAENNVTSDMEHLFVVRSVSDAGEDGFRVRIENGSFIIECAYANAFLSELDAFLEKNIYSKSGAVSFPADYLYEAHVSTVKYSDYGAVGDGVTDDFEAILRAHTYANAGGQKVIAQSGKTYYIGESSHGKEIIVQTDVDWTGATIVIDDSILPAKSGARAYSVFVVTPSAECRWYGLSTDAILDKPLLIGDTNIGFTFDGPRMVRLTNANHQIFIRYGSNGGMSNQTEVLLVDADGNIDPSTPIMWNYSALTKVESARIDESPITIKGGTVITKANVLYDFTEEELKPKEEGGGGWASGSQYYYYNRGIYVSRSHTTITGLTHLVEGENDDGGYPYNGFIAFSKCYDILVKDCVFTGRKTYHTMSNDTDMGSYDISVGDAIGVTFKNCVQSNDITDPGYWGIMCGNFGRNITYDGCTLSRFDAHQGIYNATIKNTTLGHSFSVIGGGTVLVENTRKIGQDSDLAFLTIRPDYGSLWRGDIIIRNCSMETTHADGAKSVDIIFGAWDPGWANWYFGYDLYMPQNITIENFTCPGADLYIFYWWGFSGAALTCKYPVVTTKNVTITNQTQALYLSEPGSYFYTLKDNNLLTVNGSVN